MADIFEPADTCPKNPEGIHRPDWNTVIVDADGDTLYVDVACRYCNRSGCIGSEEELTALVTWSE